MPKPQGFINEKYTTDITPSKYPRLWGTLILIGAFFVQDGGGDNVDISGTYAVPASKVVVKRAEDQLRDQCTYGDVIALAHDHKPVRTDTEAGAILDYLFRAQWSTIEE